MTRDLADRLERAALAPSRPLDVAALVGAAIRRRRRQRVGVALATVAVAVVAVAVPVLQARQTDVNFVQPHPQPDDAVSPSPPPKVSVPLTKPEKKRERTDTSACFDPPVDGYGGRRSARADIDGDGRDDAVSLVGEPRGRGGACRYSLVVRTEQATLRRRLPASAMDRGTAPAALSLQGFYELNNDPGQDIVVQTIEGATGAAHVALTLVDGDLRVVVEADGEPTLFNDFSSAGHGNATDCVDDQLVRTGYSGTKNFTHYKVTRDFFTIDLATIVPARSHTVRVPYEGGLDRFPEFSNGGALFQHCKRRGG